MTDDDPIDDDISEDEEMARLMEDHDIDQGTAEEVQELIDGGLDEDRVFVNEPTK
jgi:hypothetical protein